MSLFNNPEKDWEIILGRHPMPHPSPRFSTEGGLEIEKTDSTTVKTIAEPYFLASVNFYRTAIDFFQRLASTVRHQMMPCAIIAFATFMKPAMLAPFI